MHAIAVDLLGIDGVLHEGALDGTSDVDTTLRLGRNSFLGTGWLPPDPPPGHGPHRYAFQVFALADGPAFEGHPGRDTVTVALAARAIASGCLVGTYERHDTTIKSAEAARVASTGPDATA